MPDSGRLGDAELALGRRTEAQQAYAQALAGASEIGSGWQHDASASLARVALSAGDDGTAQTAMDAVKPILDHIAAGGTLDGTLMRRLIELTCHQALARAGDPRAADWLALAHSALWAQADAISDAALRQGFLQNVPHHREILTAWAKRDLAGVASAQPER